MDPILKEILERFSDGIRGQRSREAMERWLRGHDTAELLLIQDNWEWPRQRMAKDLLDEELERRRMGQWDREIGAPLARGQTPGGLDKGAVQSDGLDKGAVQSRRSTPSRTVPPGESLATPELRAESAPSPGGTFTAELGPIEIKAGDEVVARANAAGRRRASLGTPIPGRLPGEGGVGRTIITHRQEILQTGPGLKATIDEILVWYHENRPNDPDTQKLVERLEALSTGLDTYLAVLQTQPTEAKAERVGKSLFKKALSAIKALEKTTTGDKIVRVATFGVILGVAAIAAPMLSPYLTVPLMTACVFPKETKVATGLFKVLEDLARKFGVLPPKSHD